VPVDKGWEDTHGSGEDCTCNSQEKHQLYEVSNNALGKEITQSDGFSVAWLLNKTKDSLFNAICMALNLHWRDQTDSRLETWLKEHWDSEGTPRMKV